jgi:hypothetical protein
MVPDLGNEAGERMDFLTTAVMLRELRGWPNDPVYNAAIVYDMYGWGFDERDALLIEDEKHLAALSKGGRNP